MKRAVLFTGHYWNSKRQAGFHWIARSLIKKGWEVLFFTAPFSWFSILRRDYRTQYPVYSERCKLIRKEERLRSFVWFTPWHPVDFRSGFLNRICYKLFSGYGDFSLGEAESFIKKSNLIIFESNPVLFLVKRLKALCPDTRMVYRVSDDLRLLRCHPALLDLEQNILPTFDLISVPSQYIYNFFAKQPHLKLHTHGVSKELFDKKYPNPYKAGHGPNLVFIGQAHFDHDFLEIATGLFPNWHFHIIGPLHKSIKRDNVRFYGEMPFNETIPYVKHADIGLHTLAHARGAESFTDSLKMIQYEYCRLPIIAPDYLNCNRPQVHYYKPGEPDSINSALSRAIRFDRSKISADHVNSWDDLTDYLTGEKTEQRKVDRLPKN